MSVVDKTIRASEVWNEIRKHQQRKNQHQQRENQGDMSRHVGLTEQKTHCSKYLSL